MSETGHRDPHAPTPREGPPGSGPGEPPVRVVVDGVPPKRPFVRRVLRWVLFLGIAAANVAVAAAIGAYLYFSRGLPDLPTPQEYRPPIITEVVSSDGQIAG